MEKLANNGDIGELRVSVEFTASESESLYCQLCFRDRSLQEMVTLTACGHRFCQLCVERFINLQIYNEHAHILCLYDDAGIGVFCGVPILPKDIQELVGADTFFVYEELKSMSRTISNADSDLVLVDTYSNEDDSDIEAHETSFSASYHEMSESAVEAACRINQTAAETLDSEPLRGVRQVVTCQICQEVQDTVMLSSCNHRFCLDCLKRFLSLKINEGEVHLTCFYEDPSLEKSVCRIPIEPDDIRSLVEAETFAKYEKFRFNQRHKHARQCPHCEFSQVCEGPERPACICSSCNKPFCFTHGNAHVDSMSCRQFEKKQRRVDARTRRVIRRISKPCPHCLAPVEKNGGCNHMSCLSCLTHFCWNCGEKLNGDIGAHYSMGNIRGCAGQQMAQTYGLTSTNVFVSGLAHTTLYLVAYPLAFLLTAIAMPLSCFYLRWINRHDFTCIQVARWMFGVLAVSGYIFIEFYVVVIVGCAIAMVCVVLYGVWWGCIELLEMAGRLIICISPSRAVEAASPHTPAIVFVHVPV